MILLTRKTNACTHLENLLLLYCLLVSVETFELLFTLFFFSTRRFYDVWQSGQERVRDCDVRLKVGKKKSQLTNI